MDSSIRYSFLHVPSHSLMIPPLYQGTKVLLNIYDLSPANDALWMIGFGLHHSGVEISGTEYSFASGGGIFESTPKQASGAQFRVTVELGAYDGGQAELRKALMGKYCRYLHKMSTRMHEVNDTLSTHRSPR
jgi:PPPDE putative peptidase domain